MDSNTPTEGNEERKEASEEDCASTEPETLRSEDSPTPQVLDSAAENDRKTDADAAEVNDHGASEETEITRLSDESERNAQNSSHEDDDSALEPSEKSETPTTLKPKRLSRLAENDKPPEDPKFRFLSDPERDGKGCAGSEESKDVKEDEKHRDAERRNKKKVSRIPSARRGNRGAGQCESCGGCQNVRRPHEDPAGEQRRDRTFQRNTRERNSYPGPRRQDSRADEQQKWGHAMYYELYGEEQLRPQRPRRRGRGEYQGGGPPRDFNNNRDENRAEGNDGNPRYNGNRRPDAKGDRFGGPRRQGNIDAVCPEKHDEDPTKNRQNYNIGNGSGGERGGRRGQGGSRGRGSFRRRNNQKLPSTETKEDESVPATANA